MLRRFVKNKVVRWVDGDTVILNVDLGFKVWSEQKFRLARVNTPEVGQPGYREAVAYVNEAIPAGSEIVVDCLGLDKYGRWIAEVYLPGTFDSVNLNDSLVSKGLAVPYL